MASERTALESCICKIVQAFYEFSTLDKEKETLTKAELEKLIKEHFPNLLKKFGSVNELIQEIDKNKDQEVKFSEYWTLVGILAKDCKREEKRRH